VNSCCVFYGGAAAGTRCAAPQQSRPKKRRKKPKTGRLQGFSYGSGQLGKKRDKYPVILVGI
jgi:hypothetical protein